MYCPQCNSELPDDSCYCPECGASDARTLEDMPVQCPECGKYSDSIKCFRLPGLFLFLLIFVRWATQGKICCPSCMRKEILIHGCTYNIITGNILWLLMILPWSLVQFLRTYTKGHSHEVISILRDNMQE